MRPDANCGKDAILHGLASERTVNYGSNPQFGANSWTYQGIPGNVRSIVQFDLSQLPPDAVITSAYLSLYAWPYSTGFGQHSHFSQSNIGWLRRVTSSWDENTVTWNIQPTNTAQNQVVVPESTSPTEDYLNMDVTQLVQDMIDNPSQSFGFLLMEQINDYYCRLNFCSSDFPDITKHPKLVINYTSQFPQGSSISLGPDFTICPGESYTISVLQTNGTYHWQDGSTYSSFHITGPGTYWVDVATCSETVSDTVVVTAGDCPAPLLEFPNVFTPNGDGINDLFEPIVESGIKSMHLLIIDRWGLTVFESDELNPAWDGKINGEKASEGVYFWVADYTDNTGKYQQAQGDIAIFE